MPVTFFFPCTVVFAMVLLVSIVPISLLLIGRGRNRTGLAVFFIPGGMVLLSGLFTFLALIGMHLHSHRMSSDPPHLFEQTFGFTPPREAEILEGYCKLGVDWEQRVMRFRAPGDVIDAILRERFVPSDREAATRVLLGYGNDLPERVRAWFAPVVEQADRFYTAKPFNKSFTTHNEAILCYTGTTGVACFFWIGID